MIKNSFWKKNDGRILVPREVMQWLCTLSGHIGHDRYPWNRGWFCLDGQEYDSFNNRFAPRDSQIRAVKKKGLKAVKDTGK